MLLRISHIRKIFATFLVGNSLTTSFKQRKEILLSCENYTLKIKQLRTDAFLATSGITRD